MIRAALQTNKGPIGIIGIDDENLRQMKAGMPLDINIRDITPPGTRMNQIVIHFAHTYEDTVKDMEEAGLPVNEEFRQTARELDEERRQKRREQSRAG